MSHPSPLNYDGPTIYQRILVIDDDAGILQLMELTLSRAGYEVLTALSGEEALELIERRGLPHLAIVDILMPGMDGFEFCRAVHEFCDLPIILLSAVVAKDTVVQGIQECAEDYITKPFSPRELAARVERVLRRIGDFAYALQPLTDVDERLAVDFAAQQVIVDGEPVHLTPTESKLLYVLMRNGGRAVATDYLLRRVWPLTEVYEDSLRVHIRRLRQKIEMEPSQPYYILTERGLGYRFLGPR